MVDDEPVVKKEEVSEEAKKEQERLKEVLDYHSPLDEPPLKDLPTVETVDEDEDLAPHLRESEQRKPGDPNPDEKPMDFTFNPIPVANPTTPGLPPEEMTD